MDESSKINIWELVIWINQFNSNTSLCKLIQKIHLIY